MFSVSATARIAIEKPANIIDICIHPKNVRSLAKKTFGSILIGAARGLTNLIAADPPIAVEVAASVFLLPPNNLARNPVVTGWVGFFCFLYFFGSVGGCSYHTYICFHDSSP